MALAEEKIKEMRDGGAATTTRSVTAKLWDTEIRNPPLLQASYYDEAQGLSADERYAARVHDEHWMFDRGGDFTYQGYPLTYSYPAWDGDIEPKPDTCPHCGTSLHMALQLQAAEQQLGRATRL
ncbi:hypothetical protein [Nocardia sp. NPDC058633]|uniref:hypothetical protein n=1 Tax=Nocardia sp. NPDC058633 TaxID=3346568 RepID=UPI0036696100